MQTAEIYDCHACNVFYSYKINTFTYQVKCSFQFVYVLNREQFKVGKYYHSVQKFFIFP